MAIIYIIFSKFIKEGWQNGNALVSKTSGRKPLEVRALYPPPSVAEALGVPMEDSVN